MIANNLVTVKIIENRYLPAFMVLRNEPDRVYIGSGIASLIFMTRYFPTLARYWAPPRAMRFLRSTRCSIKTSR